jgi:hypothetical protein
MLGDHETSEVPPSCGRSLKVKNKIEDRRLLESPKAHGEAPILLSLLNFGVSSWSRHKETD